MGVKEIYYAACKRYRKQADDPELKREWQQILGGYTDAELWAAWEWWRGNTDCTDQGLPRGMIMPTAVFLKARIEAQRKTERILRNEDERQKFHPCGRDGCANGWRPGEQNGRRGVVRCACWYEWRSQKLQEVS